MEFVNSHPNFGRLTFIFLLIKTNKIVQTGMLKYFKEIAVKEVE